MKFGLIAGLRRNARERMNAIFLFPVLLISLGSKSGTPFLAEGAKTCQHYFWILFCKHFRPATDCIGGLGESEVYLTTVVAAVSAAKNPLFL